MSGIGSILALLFLVFFLFAFVSWEFMKFAKQRRQIPGYLTNVDDVACSVEVLYEGEVVADLSERVAVEMFWSTYQIRPRTPAGAELIGDDDLWNACAFYFREPGTGILCTTGQVGGSAPFVQDGRIMLRGMYFGIPAKTRER